MPRNAVSTDFRNSQKKNLNLQSLPVRIRTWLGSVKGPRIPVYTCVPQMSTRRLNSLRHFGISFIQGSQNPIGNSELDLCLLKSKMIKTNMLIDS